MFDYDIKQLKKSLKRLGLKKNDVVFCHSNLAYFGKLKEANNKNKLCSIFFNTLFKIIGSEGTLIVPTFTYSFSKKRHGIYYKKKEIFDVNKTQSEMGIFSEWIRNKKNSIRSLDPFFSVAVIGKNKNIVKSLSNHSFDENSVFSRLLLLNAKFLNFNFSGHTFLHYVERLLDVNYRFDKTVSGYINLKGKKVFKKWNIYSQYLFDKRFSHNPYFYDDYIKKKKICNFTNLGRGEMLSITAKNIYKVVKKMYLKNKWFLTDAFKENNKKNKAHEK